MKGSWADLPSHRAFRQAVDWYWRSLLSLLAATAFGFVLSRLVPYPRLPLPVYLVGFLSFPVMLAVAFRHTWRMLNLRRQEMTAGKFAGAPRYLLFLDQHAIAIGVIAVCTALLIGIVVAQIRGG